MTYDVATLQDALRNRFGLAEFRPGQIEAISDLMTYGRVLCILPTGHGKSLLYQLPTLLLEGLTLVVSPLLALMRDQLDQLNSRFKLSAASINSDQSNEENYSALAGARAGHIKLLFVSPERLDNLETYEAIINLPISLFVVDEAHCISVWGHDFRPAYRQIVRTIHAIETLRPGLKILGLTATANQRTEEDIAAQLTSVDGKMLRVHRRSMDRPNLALSVIPADGAAQKLTILKKLLCERKGKVGVIYCATRENVELVSDYLALNDLPNSAYHAGFEPEQKRSIQTAFFSGQVALLVATNALGMGIDKRDIRYIVHFDIPGSITAYYQEVGRAGRDGLPAEGVLILDLADRAIQQYFITSAQPSGADVEKVLTCIRNDSTQLLSLMRIKSLSGLHPTLVTVILAELVEQGIITKELIEKSQVYRVHASDQKIDLTRYERQRTTRIAELEAVLAYGSSKSTCRMQILRKALGDNNAEECGRCDLCLRQEMTFEGIDSAKANDWIVRRPFSIAATKIPKMCEGSALLDGALKTTTFVSFMRHRTTENDLSELSPMLFAALDQVMNVHQFACVIPIPSRTWLSRDATALRVAKHLSVPCFLELLSWSEMPVARQGELLNNDQRRDNVRGKLTTRGKIPRGAILLVDDYIGSGATLKEAVTALRKSGGAKDDIVPFTIARVRWRLGSPGMI